MRTLSILILLISTFSTVGGAAEKWVFLKDGRLCMSSMESEPFTGREQNGTRFQFGMDLVQGIRTPEQLEQAVDGMMLDMVRGKKFEEHAARLKVFRASAVPALLKHLAKEQINERLSALYGLSYCWSPAAVNPVVEVLGSQNNELAMAAFIALERNLQTKDLAILVKDWADGPDAKKAALVFRVVDPIFPDEKLQRVKRLMETSEGRSAVAPYLSHYLSADLAPGITRLMASEKIEELRNAVIGLISAGAGDTSIRVQVLSKLNSSDVDLRQLIAEYFARFGTAVDIETLKKASSKEQNAYVKAALEAAVTVINSRSSSLEKLAITESAKWKALNENDLPASKFALCIDILRHQPGAIDNARARSIFRTAVISEPHYIYAGDPPAWAENHRQRNALERVLLLAPCGHLESAEEPDTSRPEVAAKKFVPPIEGYFDAKRKSFGFSMPTTGVFGNSVHIGDDCGWRREFRTIVSIGNGRVCRAAYIPSWGHLLIVEHRLPDETRVCSLYGHTSSFIYVKPGDSVVAGQKIATIGRPHSIENGGYGAHLHFGIHAGAYDGGIWISGYLSKAGFGDGRHGWLNPQTFLQDHR